MFSIELRIMNKKLLNGILVALGAVVMLFLTFPFGMILALAFWIYLGVIVWKKRRVFNDKLEQGLKVKYIKRIKTFLIAAGISFPVAIVGVIMHNVRSSSSGTEEVLYFFIGIIALYLFVLASAGGLVTFLKGRKNQNEKEV